MSFSDFIAAAEAGAASIYHDVLATGEEILSWGSSPLVSTLLTAGAATANGMLSRFGIATGTASLIEADIVAALKGIAAKDPTVPSVGAISSLLGVAGTVVSSLIPGAAAGIAIAEGVGSMIESVLVTKTTTVVPAATSDAAPEIQPIAPAAS